MPPPNQIRTLPKIAFEAPSRHIRIVTKLLDQALEAARSLPPDAQDDIARVVLRLAGTGDEVSPVTLTQAELEAITLSKAAAAHGDFATDAQGRAV